MGNSKPMHGDSEANVVAIPSEPSSRSRSVAVDTDPATSGSGLDGRQIFFLFVGSAVFACLVFATGVFVGRRIERGAAAQAAQQSASDPLAILDEIANAEESLTFHRTLASSTTTPAARPVRPTAPPSHGSEASAHPTPAAAAAPASH